MDDIFRIAKYLEDCGVLLKGVIETIQNEAKEQRGGFLSMLLGTLGLLYLVIYYQRIYQIKEQLELVKEQLELGMVPKSLPLKHFDSYATSFKKL